MNALIQDKRTELFRLCEQYHVQRLELFGSATTDHFDPERSDLDFLVQFQPLSCADHARSYFGLLEAFELLFERSVDLVELSAIRNPYFMEAITTSRVVFYAA